MATAAQVAANRRNAHNSTGPKSCAGKARAARNARRHGLATSLWSDPILANATEAFVCELAGPAASPDLQNLAREAAAAHMAVDRVRQVRHHLMVQQLEDPVLIPTTPRAAKQHVRDVIELCERVFIGLHTPWRIRSLLRLPEGAEKYALVISNLTRKLAVLERYERRAESRRKRAFRKLVAEQRKSKAISDAAKSDGAGSRDDPHDLAERTQNSAMVSMVPCAEQ